MNAYDLNPISMYQVAGNLWREEKRKVEVLHVHHVNYSVKFYDALTVSSELILAKGYVRDELNVQDPEFMHCLVQWLHPGFKPVYLGFCEKWPRNHDEI